MTEDRCIRDHCDPDGQWHSWWCPLYVESPVQVVKKRRGRPPGTGTGYNQGQKRKPPK